jgi:hypothetical protein
MFLLCIVARSGGIFQMPVSVLCQHLSSGAATTAAQAVQALPAPKAIKGRRSSYAQDNEHDMPSVSNLAPWWIFLIEAPIKYLDMRAIINIGALWRGRIGYPTIAQRMILIARKLMHRNGKAQAL